MSNIDEDDSFFNWSGVVDGLHRLSKNQIVQFLGGPDKDDVYGFGFFCDGSDGTIHLVANTQQYFLSSLRDFQSRYGPTDPEEFRWEIGNWKYPGGLFPSSTAEQREFDEVWQAYQEQLSDIESDGKQEMLENICFQVLSRLIHDGVFSTVRGLEGFTILGPQDYQENVLETKKRFDKLVDSVDKRPK